MPASHFHKFSLLLALSLFFIAPKSFADTPSASPSSGADQRKATMTAKKKKPAKKSSATQTPGQEQSVSETTNSLTPSKTPASPLTTIHASEAIAAPRAVGLNERGITRRIENPEGLDIQLLPEIEIVGNTPIGTTGMANKKIAGNVQQADDKDINLHEAYAISDFMNRRLENVSINDVQNNPYQPDISYRGFTASPLAGTPIGISVYQDGVRVNEPFGDTVNWDLIPQVAIANMEMVPGSNPIYGLNTLGGSLSIRTKSGFTHPGFQAQAYGGSFGRQNYQMEYGGSSGNIDWFFAGNYFGDGGWRAYSPTSVAQAFGKVGYEDEKTDLDLSFTFADNNMQGVGGTPSSMLQQNYYSVYTSPDVTTNEMFFGTLKGIHKITDELEFGGNVYFRNNTMSNLNSNVPSSSDCPNGYLNSTFCQNPSPDLPGSGIYAATFTSSTTRENGTGINLQITSNYKLFDHENQFVLGGGINYAHTNFWQGQNNAIFAPIPYEVGISPFIQNANISGQNLYSNLFASDTFSVTSWLHGTAALNWQQAQITTVDNAASTDNNALAGNAYYAHVNPSAGFTVNPLEVLEIDSPLKDFTGYFNYNEGMRAPTSMEMACADPNAPCALPNAMASDPPLKAVIAQTLEVGFRSKIYDDTKWNMALFQTRSSNDIQYIPAPQNSNNLGYFTNVGTTQRMGAEFGMSGVVLESLNWYMSYGFVNATYQSAMTLQAPNPYGPQQVKSGDRIPSIPQNTVKFGAEYPIFKDFFFGGDLQYQGSQFARGDFANQYGQIPAFTIVNLNAKYFVTKNIELFAMARNIFNEHYGNYGQLGQNYFAGNSATTFISPGAPATGYAGVRLHWD